MQPNRCNCGKVKSSTIEASRLLHARVWAHEGGEPVRYYRCKFGMWHWTRSPLRNKKAS